MDSKLNFIVDEKNCNVKLRDFLRNTAGFSGRLTKGCALSGRIKVNNNTAKLNLVLKKGDIVEVTIEKEESQNVEPEKMDLDIVYEDIDVVVVNKPFGMVVHPTRNHITGTLANGLLYYFKEKGEKCIVRLVSRLDRDTSGLIIIAKNQFSHMCLARDMVKEEFEKSYIAVIHGNMEDTEGTIDLPILRPSQESINRVVDINGQRSITHYKVQEKIGNSEILKLTLETGRTHQIRVHLSHLGHPIYGDTLYGTEDDTRYISRQALHAYRLVFPHPRTGKLIVVESDLPEDIKNLISIIKDENN
ncbi:MAG: RluA family pseudouridine synthase [Bacillota bacterium]|nr:RluA family pseudouridine synthase [Bacillota bacterium]